MDKQKHTGRSRVGKDEASFNLGRLRKSIRSGHRVVPVGLNTDEIIEWIAGKPAKDGADR